MAMKRRAMIELIRHAQRQNIIYKIISQSPIADQVFDFMFEHYNSAYNHSKHGWTKSSSYKITDLNDAQNMAITAISNLD